MKKIILSTIMGSLLMGGIVSATSIPVTDIGTIHLEANADVLGMYKNEDRDDSSHFHGYNVNASYGGLGLLAGQIGHTEYKGTVAGEHTTMKVNEMNAYYALFDNLNLYGGLMRIHMNHGDDDTVKKQNIVAGAVAHINIGKVQAFGKIGYGTKLIEKQIQLGLKYDIAPHMNVHAMYERNNVVHHRQTNHVNGYSLGVGYSF